MQQLCLFFLKTFGFISSSFVYNCPLVPIGLMPLPSVISLLNESIYGMHLALGLALCECSSKLLLLLYFDPFHIPLMF